MNSAEALTPVLEREHWAFYRSICRQPLITEPEMEFTKSILNLCQDKSAIVFLHCVRLFHEICLKQYYRTSGITKEDRSCQLCKKKLESGRLTCAPMIRVFPTTMDEHNTRSTHCQTIESPPLESRNTEESFDEDDDTVFHRFSWEDEAGVRRRGFGEDDGTDHRISSNRTATVAVGRDGPDGLASVSLKTVSVGTDHRYEELNEKS